MFTGYVYLNKLFYNGILSFEIFIKMITFLFFYIFQYYNFYSFISFKNKRNNTISYSLFNSLKFKYLIY